MKFLAIETSTDLASIALQIGNTVVVAEQNTAQQHTQHLLPMIERLLAEVELKVKDLDGIAFGCGPGSFTGLRVACSLAKGLAYACDLPLYPVSSLMSIAYACLDDQKSKVNCLTLLDARMQQLYWALYDSGCNLIMPPSVTKAEDIQLDVAGDIILGGVGFESYAVDSLLNCQNRIIQQRIVYPHARSILALIAKVQPVSALLALPMYVRNNVT